MPSQQSNFISMDLELNQPSGKIIQVGICIGRRWQPESDYIIKQWIIDPDEPIVDLITSLTGISDDDIRDRSVSWSQMNQELKQLIELHQPFINPVTWGGGDSTSLSSSIREKGLEFSHFGRRWIDVKTFHFMLSLSIGKSSAGGLSSAMKKHGMTFQGNAHRADVDAFNTLRLFFKLLEYKFEKPFEMPSARSLMTNGPKKCHANSDSEKK